MVTESFAIAPLVLLTQDNTTDWTTMTTFSSLRNMTTSPPQTNVTYGVSHHSPAHWVSAIVLGMLAIMGMMGNSGVVTVVVRITQLQRMTYILVANISTIGLLVSTLCIPTHILLLLGGGQAFVWEGSVQEGLSFAQRAGVAGTLCKAQAFLNFALILATLINLAAIAVCRYKAVTAKHSTRLQVESRKTILKVLCFIWLLPVLMAISASPFVGYNARIMNCFFRDVRQAFWYMMAGLSVPALASSICMCSLYGLILKKVRDSNLKIMTLQHRHHRKGDGAEHRTGTSSYISDDPSMASPTLVASIDPRRISTVDLGRQPVLGLPGIADHERRASSTDCEAYGITIFTTITDNTLSVPSTTLAPPRSVSPNSQPTVSQKTDLIPKTNPAPQTKPTTKTDPTPQTNLVPKTNFSLKAMDTNKKKDVSCQPRTSSVGTSSGWDSETSTCSASPTNPAIKNSSQSSLQEDVLGTNRVSSAEKYLYYKANDPKLSTKSTMGQDTHNLVDYSDTSSVAIPSTSNISNVSEPSINSVNNSSTSKMMNDCSQARTSSCSGQRSVTTGISATCRDHVQLTPIMTSKLNYNLSPAGPNTLSPVPSTTEDITEMHTDNLHHGKTTKSGPCKTDAIAENSTDDLKSAKTCSSKERLPRVQTPASTEENLTKPKTPNISSPNQGLQTAETSAVTVKNVPKLKTQNLTPSISVDLLPKVSISTSEPSSPTDDTEPMQTLDVQRLTPHPLTATPHSSSYISLDSSSVTNVSVTNAESSVTTVDANKHGKTHRFNRRFKREVNLMFHLFLAFLVFCLMYLPLCFAHIVHEFHPMSDDAWLALHTLALAFASNMWLLYALLNKDFQHAFKALLAGRRVF